MAGPFEDGDPEPWHKLCSALTEGKQPQSKAAAHRGAGKPTKHDAGMGMSLRCVHSRAGAGAGSTRTERCSQLHPQQAVGVQTHLNRFNTETRSSHNPGLPILSWLPPQPCLHHGTSPPSRATAAQQQQVCVRQQTSQTQH